MNSLILYQVLLSFFLGGGFVVGSLWVAERFGSKFGGVVAGLPTTAAIAILFIGIFLVSYGYFSNFITAGKALVFSTIVWLVLASMSL